MDQPQKCDIAIGIDFGTTFSSVSLCINGKIIPVNFPGEGAQVPTIVYYGEDGQCLIGKRALRHAAKRPASCFSHFKRGVLASPDQAKDGQPTPLQLATDCVREKWRQLLTVHPDITNYIAELGGKRSPELLRIFIANPSNCGIEQRKTYQRLASGVGDGFKLDGQIDEPIAASFQYRQQHADRIRHGHRLPIIDIGGGTTDVTVLQSNRGILDTVVGARGDTRLGGVDFTGVLFLLLCDKLGFRGKQCFEPGKGLNLAAKGLSDPQRTLAAILWEQAEDAKLQLSTFDSATLYVEASKGSLEEIVIPRDEFLRRAEPLFQRFEKTVTEALLGSGLGWSDVEHILLVGGSAMVPTLVERLAKVVGRDAAEIYRSNDSAQLVASGAAYQAFTQEGTARHLANGLGVRLKVGKAGTTNRNRLFFRPGQVVPVSGTTVEALGQFLESKGGPTTVSLDLIEAKPGITTEPTNGTPLFLDDEHVIEVDKLRLDFDLPAGEHEVRVLCTIDPGNQVHMGVSFPKLSGVEAQAAKIGQAQTNGKKSRAKPLTCALILDNSGSMDGSNLTEAKRAIGAFADVAIPHGAQLSLIAFGDQARKLCSLSSDRTVLDAAIEQLVADGGTPMAEALRLAIDDFRAAPQGARKVAILATDGAPNSIEEAQQAAQALKADGVTLVCVGIGEDVCEHFLVELASSPELYHFAYLPSDLTGLFANIAHLYVTDEGHTP